MNTSYKAILKEFLKWIDTLGFSDSVTSYCDFSLCDFFRWLEERKINEINLLTNKHITEYHKHLETRPNKVFKGRLLGGAHLNHYFMAVDKLLEFLHQYGMKTAPIPTNYRIKADEQERIRKIEILTQQEIKTLYNSIENAYPRFLFEERQAKQYELKLIFALYYACGLRLAEGFNLQMQHIDFDKKTIFVEKGKFNKDRFVPMSAGVYKELQEYIYNFRYRLKLNHNCLFVCNLPNTITKKIKYLQRICEDETIKAKRLSPHVFRHSIATHLLQNGMSIENIALFLGHSSLDTTQIYTHLV